MGMRAYLRRRRWVAALGLLVALCVAPVLASAAEGALPKSLTSMSEAAIDGAAPADDPARTERWNALREAVFGKRPVIDGTAVIQLEAPVRALDACRIVRGCGAVDGGLAHRGERLRKTGFRRARHHRRYTQRHQKPQRGGRAPAP